MAVELDSRFDPAKVEQKWYEVWENSGVFTPKYSKADLPSAAKKTAKKSAKKKAKAKGKAKTAAKTAAAIALSV